MPKQLKDVSPRTVRVHIPTYNKILEFFNTSPAGLCGSDAIRHLLHAFGTYCSEQMEQGRVASSKDLRAAEELIARTFKDNTNVRPSE